MKQPSKNKYVVGQEYYVPIDWDGEQTVHVFIYQGIVYSKGEQLHQFREARFTVDAVPEEGLRHYAVRDVLEGPLTSLELRKAIMSKQEIEGKRQPHPVGPDTDDESVLISGVSTPSGFLEHCDVCHRGELEALLTRTDPICLGFKYEPTVEDLEIVVQFTQNIGITLILEAVPRFVEVLEPLSYRENLKSFMISPYPCPENTFLEMLETFTGLQVLNLFYSRISDQLGVALNELEDLHSLKLTNTKITDLIKYDLAGLSRMTRLTLDQTRITDDFFRIDDLWPQLEILSLNATRITDQGVALLHGLPGLRDLELDGTDITDAAIPSLLQMPQLKYLSVEKTAITVRGARELIEGMADCNVRC